MSGIMQSDLSRRRGDCILAGDFNDGFVLVISMLLALNRVQLRQNRRDLIKYTMVLSCSPNS